MSDFSQKYSIAGIETLTINMPVAGQFVLDGKISFPRPSQGDSSASAIVATIKQNGSTIFTTTAGSDGFSIPIQAAVADVFTVALSSSQAEDEVLNAVKCVVSVG